MSNYFHEIELLEKLITLYRNRGDHDSYLKYLNQAIELSGSSNDIERHVDYLYEMAEDYAARRRLEDYFSIIYKAISISEENRLLDAANMYLDEMISMCERYEYYDFYDYALNKKLELLRNS